MIKWYFHPTEFAFQALLQPAWFSFKRRIGTIHGRMSSAVFGGVLDRIKNGQLHILGCVVKVDLVVVLGAVDFHAICQVLGLYGANI